ncbi:MAG: cytochrome c oxidase assembly protein [Rhodospirillaceae bacterium]
MTDRPQKTRNLITAAVLFSVVGGMVGLSFAAVPLYKLFCQVTGFGGTTQVAEAKSAPGATTDRRITVTFDANVARDLGWRFEAEQGKVSVKVGEQGLAFYKAVNKESHAVTGMAAFNVTPHEAGLYFAKIECFCFAEQTLQPGQSVDMPVQFFIDPEILNDSNMRDVTDIVLSYTFHRAEKTQTQTSAVAGSSDKTGG